MFSPTKGVMEIVCEFSVEIGLVLSHAIALALGVMGINNDTEIYDMPCGAVVAVVALWNSVLLVTVRIAAFHKPRYTIYIYWALQMSSLIPMMVFSLEIHREDGRPTPIVLYLYEMALATQFSLGTKHLFQGIHKLQTSCLR